MLYRYGIGEFTEADSAADVLAPPKQAPVIDCRHHRDRQTLEDTDVYGLHLSCSGVAIG